MPSRLETAVSAWGVGERCIPIEMKIIPGDPGLPETNVNSPWRELALPLGKTYPHAFGV